jgi:hypothetical protein
VILGRSTCPPSAPFRVGQVAYPAGYVFPMPFGSRRWLLRASRPRCGFRPSLPRACCDRRMPHRGCRVPHPRGTTGVGVPCTPEARCRHLRPIGCEDHGQALSATCLTPRSPGSVGCRCLFLTEPRWGFTRVRPSRLPLACSFPPTGTPLGRLVGASDHPVARIAGPTGDWPRHWPVGLQVLGRPPLLDSRPHSANATSRRNDS